MTDGEHARPVDDARTAELAANLRAATTRLDAATAAAGRPAGAVRLMVVTKFFPAADVVRLLGLGVRLVGESREPEAGRKVDEVAAAAAIPAGTRFAMIGRVQRKKARTIARWASEVHAVDSTDLTAALSVASLAARDAGARDADLDCLVQLSLDGDPARGGVPPAGLEAVADAVAAAPALRLAGVMAVPPLAGEAERWLELAAQIHRRLVATHPDARELSLGMSGDLEAAVRHGSTCVRVGTAIVGPRPLTSP